MKILVSACLLGCNCKYNGGNNLNRRVIDYVKNKEVIEICPEMMAGAGAPRPCAEIVGGRIKDEHGADVDEVYRTGVLLALQAIAGVGNLNWPSFNRVVLPAVSMKFMTEALQGS